MAVFSFSREPILYPLSLASLLDLSRRRGFRPVAVCVRGGPHGGVLYFYEFFKKKKSEYLEVELQGAAVRGKVAGSVCW